VRRIGAILAGGSARRFGSDKAAALLDGRALIDHIAAALAHQVDALVVVGRSWPGLTGIDDRPAAGLGPLGGLCGALGHADANGFTHVISHPCDLLPVPVWSDAVLASGQAFYAQRHYVSGVWPQSLYPQLIEYLSSGPVAASMDPLLRRARGGVRADDGYEHPRRVRSLSPRPRHGRVIQITTSAIPSRYYTVWRPRARMRRRLLNKRRKRL
jgi:molybdenum cofactor guanylyltransferase